MKRFLYNRYDRLRAWLVPGLRAFFCGVRRLPFKDVPIVINNFNRLDSLKRLIAGLESRGYRNIHIIDKTTSYQKGL